MLFRSTLALSPTPTETSVAPASTTPSLTPTVLPTSEPSPTPSVALTQQSSPPSLFGSIPSNFPTNFATVSESDIFSFSARVTMVGLGQSMLDRTTLESDFMNSIMKSMTGVSRSDVFLFKSPYYQTINIPSASQRSLLDLKNRNSGHVVISDVKSYGSLTFNASAPLTKLNATSGEMAFSSLSTQLNNTMNDGSFLFRMIAASNALQPVTRAYITMLGYSVYKLAPSQSPSLSPSSTVVAVTPTVGAIRVIGVTRNSVDLSVTILKPRVLPSSSSSSSSSGEYECDSLLHRSC